MFRYDIDLDRTFKLQGLQKYNFTLKYKFDLQMTLQIVKILVIMVENELGDII